MTSLDTDVLGRGLFRIYGALIVSTFVLNSLWERLHITLYSGYEAMEGVLPVYLLATLGDVLYIVFAVLLVALFKGDILWFRTARLRDFAGLAIIGFFLALFVEYKALYLHKWAYTAAMPIVFHVGISPLLQMTVLLPLSVYICVIVQKWLKR